MAEQIIIKSLGIGPYRVYNRDPQFFANSPEALPFLADHNQGARVNTFLDAIKLLTDISNFGEDNLWQYVLDSNDQIVFSLKNPASLKFIKMLGRGGISRLIEG